MGDVVGIKVLRLPEAMVGKTSFLKGVIRRLPGGAEFLNHSV